MHNKEARSTKHETLNKKKHYLSSETYVVFEKIKENQFLTIYQGDTQTDQFVVVLDQDEIKALAEFLSKLQ
jgi:hypothetical protein